MQPIKTASSLSERTILLQKYPIFAQYLSNICRQCPIYGTKIEHNSVKSFLSDSLLDIPIERLLGSYGSDVRVWTRIPNCQF